MSNNHNGNKLILNQTFRPIFIHSFKYQTNSYKRLLARGGIYTGTLTPVHVQGREERTSSVCAGEGGETQPRV